MTRPLDDQRQGIVNFCNHAERGVYSLTTMLGRTRTAYRRDLSTPPFALDDWSLAPLHEPYRAYVARVEPAGDNQARLVLSAKWSTSEVHFLIDTTRNVVLRQESFFDGQSGGATTFSDFVEVAGSWWAGRRTITDPQGRKLAETTLEVKLLPPDEFTARVKRALATKSKAKLVRSPMVSLDIARQKQADGAADFDDLLRLLFESCRVQQWDDALATVDAIEKVSADRPGVRWIRTAILKLSRRNEVARQRLLAEAEVLATTPAAEERPLAELILSLSNELTSPAEQMEFIQRLQPVFARQPAESGALGWWQNQLLAAYQNLGREAEVTTLMQSLAKEAPWDARRSPTPTAWRSWGMMRGRTPGYRPSLIGPSSVTTTAMASSARLTPSSISSRTAGPIALRIHAAWIERKPHNEHPYREHLTALIYNDRLKDADQLAERWLMEAQADGPTARKHGETRGRHHLRQRQRANAILRSSQALV